MDGTENSRKVDAGSIVGESKPRVMSPIKVRARIFCPNCGFEKIFRNQFKRDDIELIVVTFKILDYVTCPKCTGLLSTEFSYELQ
ncbi:MAG: hypothetical protein ACTSU5_11905 [Promethearchaeota archaeon]